MVLANPKQRSLVVTVFLLKTGGATVKKTGCEAQAKHRSLVINSHSCSRQAVQLLRKPAAQKVIHFIYFANPDWHKS
jgi:hypothetical protein